MSWLRAFLVRLGGCLRRSRREQELNDEIDSHLELHVDDNVRAGMTPDEARRQAVLKLGSIEATKEAMRDRQTLPWLEHFVQDVRFAFRSLRKSPGFTTVAVLTLALCIGANSAVFSVVHAILLKPYPWPESDRLVFVHIAHTKQPGVHRAASIPDYLDWRNGVAAFEESALYESYNANLTSTDFDPERIVALGVTPSLFPLLKTRPALGRTFSEDDATIGAPNTVVLSDPLWRNRFGADPNIIGTDIRLSGKPYTVIGVMPPGFYFPRPDTQVWLPIAFTDRQKSDSARSVPSFSSVIARLKRGATLEQARRDASAVQKAAAERQPAQKASWEAQGRDAAITGMLEANVKDVRAMLWFVQGAVAAALLIGCANVASLLLARASARERELAVRAALGASRGRLTRYLLTESVLLFATGGLLGLGLAVWGVSAMNHLGVGSLPRGFSVSLDIVVFGVTLLGAVASGLMFGALPAWSATRGDNADALRDAGARATTGRRHLSLRSTLVVTEIALALMLLATAALLIKGFYRLQEISPGFPPENLLAASLVVTASNDKFATNEKKILFHNQLLERVRALSGVASATCSNGLPFAGGNMLGYEIESYTLPPGRKPSASFRFVSPDYFKTIGVPLLRGRVFTDQDNLANREVAVIDTMMAERYWPGEDPIGKRLIFGMRPVPNSTTQQPRKWEIIGVVASVKHSDRETPVTTETVYLPTMQLPIIASLMVRTTVPASQLIAPLRAVLRSIDPDLPLFNIRTMEARLEASLERRRTPMILLALFAGVALSLAAIGVYGVLAFAVGQRTKEIGVRIALGATATNIVRMILRQGAWLVALGVAIGLGGYFALSTVIRKLLFNVEITDYAALFIAPATLALVALAACLIPARRATKVDPIFALRAE